MSEEGDSKITRIAFIHPDLGIGGAERLVVDAAIGLQNLKKDITIFTSHCDRTHCFEEVSNDQLRIKVYGDFLPTSFLKKFHILFAILRQFYLTLRLIITGEINEFDYFIVDQLSFCIPLLRCFSKEDCRILLYCHFPDQLLSQRGGLIKKIYRIPFNTIEEWTTGISDKIVVNSKFTKSIFHDTFKQLHDVDPGVIYPCVDTSSTQFTDEDELADKEIREFFRDNRYFLSLNRFERKKNVELAIESFAKFKKFIPSTKKPRLVIAGGYDSRVNENVEYLNELVKLADSFKLTNFTVRGKLIIMPPSTDILFLPSIKSSIKKCLIKNAEMLLYTPSFEHFGIVPIESMLFKTPVLAVNNGGPLETVINYNGSNLDDATGFITQPNYESWSKIMIDYYTEYTSDVKQRLGNNGYNRALAMFSREHMCESFLRNLIESNNESKDKGILYSLMKLWKFELLIIFISFILFKLFS